MKHNDPPRLVAIADLRIEPALQARSTHVDPVTVNRYRGVLKAVEGDPAASAFPPIKVAEFPNGQRYVLDGFHRIAAHQAEGLTEIKATTTRCESLKEAQWEAAAANLAHGKPLTHKEMGVAFRRFVDARMHRRASEDASKSVKEQRPGPGVMTLGEIAQVFGKAKSTVRSWFQSHDRREYNLLYSNDQSERREAGGHRPIGDSVEPLSGAALFGMSIENARNVVVYGLSEEDLTDCLRAFNRVGLEIAERLGPEAVRSALDGGFAPGWVSPDTWLWDDNGRPARARPPGHFQRG